MRRLGTALTTLALALTLALTGLGPVGSPEPATAATRTLPTYLDLPPQVRQLVTVTSPRWSSTRATLSTWRSAPTAGTACAAPSRSGSAGTAGCGPATAGRTPAPRPAGRFAMPAGVRQPRRPRDPAALHARRRRTTSGPTSRATRRRTTSYQPSRASDVALAHGLPRAAGVLRLRVRLRGRCSASTCRSGVHWSAARRQYVARQHGGHPPRRRDLPARAGQPLHGRLRRRAAAPTSAGWCAGSTRRSAADRDGPAGLGEEDASERRRAEHPQELARARSPACRCRLGWAPYSTVTATPAVAVHVPLRERAVADPAAGEPLAGQVQAAREPAREAPGGPRGDVDAVQGLVDADDRGAA